jgi:hypothetical protein
MTIGFGRCMTGLNEQDTLRTFLTYNFVTHYCRFSFIWSNFSFLSVNLNSQLA